jgi:uncharacterized protein (TIRG00374 family)
MRKQARVIASGIMVALAIAAIVWLIGPQKFLYSIGRIGIPGLLVLYAMFTACWLIKGFRWKRILRQNNYELGVLDAASLSILGNFSNLLVPAKLGDAVWMYSTKKRHNVRLPVAFTTVILDRAYDFITVMALTVVSMLILTWMAFPGWVYYLLYSGIALVTMFFIALILAVKWRLLIKRVMPVKWIANALSKVTEALSQSTKNIPQFLSLILLSTVVWLIQSLMCYTVARMLSVDVGFPVMLLAVVMTNLTQAIPITPANIGVYEGVMAAVLLAAGVSLDAGLTIALIDHAIKMSYVVIAGSVVTAEHLFKAVEK